MGLSGGFKSVCVTALCLQGGRVFEEGGGFEAAAGGEGARLQEEREEASGKGKSGISVWRW